MSEKENLNKNTQTKKLMKKKPKKQHVKAGTELTYQQLKMNSQRTPTQVMDACKAAIAESSTNLKQNWQLKSKQQLQRMLPKLAAKPTGKGIIAAPDDAQKLNNMFAKKANLHKAGLELKAAAQRMAGLTADITHEEEEEPKNVIF